MHKTYIDTTELANWQGKLTGVPRVMSELTNRFTQESSLPIFLAWDSGSSSYSEASFSAPTEDGAIRYRSQFAYNKALALPIRASHRLLRTRKRVARTKILEPQSGDTLLILADWHGSDEAFINHISKLHSKGVKLVQVSYDMLPIVTPQYSGHATETFTKYVQEIYPLCNLILSISEHTRKDVANYLRGNKLRVPPIKVIRLGDDFNFPQAQMPHDTWLQGRDRTNEYILCVGTIEARKNHTLLYYVYKNAVEQGIELPPVIVVGRRGWLTENIFEIITSDPDTKDKFIFLTSTSDGELSWLYEHCLFTIYPSFYEGWGLPVAESMARGVPCIASNTSSIPEIAGNLIGYFSPSSPEACLGAIRKMMLPSQHKQYRDNIKKYKPVSWDQTFEQVKKAMKELHA
jgi:glycosyltransferase involved in cell wall biosynthesis